MMAFWPFAELVGTKTSANSQWSAQEIFYWPIITILTPTPILHLESDYTDKEFAFL